MIITDEINFREQPKFKIGDVVQMKSGGCKMTILDLYHSWNVFDGEWEVQYIDKVKIYQKDGTIEEQTQIVDARLHQNVLELVQDNITV
jgi:uncharacterized protein YodC (DUF2158 family)